MKSDVPDEVRRALRNIGNTQFIILSLVLLFRFSLLKIFTGQIDQDPPGNFALYIGGPFIKQIIVHGILLCVDCRVTPVIFGH